jgi:hypothetical protein
VNLRHYLDIDFVWFWPGWPIAAALILYVLAGAYLLRRRVLHFFLFSFAYVAVPVILWCIANPSYGANSGWAKVIAAALAIVSAPLMVVATPMLALHRFQARYMVLVGVGLLVALVATFGFFAVAHHIGCSIARIDCL